MLKKSLCIIISILFFCFQCNLASYANDIIEDSIAIEYFKGQKFTKPVFEPEFIEDKVAIESFKGKNITRPDFKPEIIEDRIAAESFKDKKPQKYIFKLKIVEDDCILQSYKGQKLTKPAFEYIILDDKVALDCFNGQKLTKPVFKYKLIDENTIEIEVFVSSTSIIATNHVHFEPFNGIDIGNRIDIGNKVKFRVLNDVKKDGKLLIQKGTLVNAIVGNIIPSSGGGSPAELTIERFVTQDIQGNKVELFGDVRKRGINLYLPYYMLAVGGYPFTFGLSIFFLYLHGGQAKIKPKQEFTLYYED